MTLLLLGEGFMKKKIQKQPQREENCPVRGDGGGSGHFHDPLSPLWPRRLPREEWTAEGCLTGAKRLAQPRRHPALTLCISEWFSQNTAL